MPKDTKTLRQRFFEKVKVGKPNECWEWQGGRNYDGYGIFHLDIGKSIGAHRYAFKLSRGYLPKTLHILHDCDNPPCCNPKHLYSGTQQENMEDKLIRNRLFKGARKKWFYFSHPNGKSDKSCDERDIESMQHRGFRIIRRKDYKELRRKH